MYQVDIERERTYGVFRRAYSADAMKPKNVLNITEMLINLESIGWD